MELVFDKTFYCNSTKNHILNIWTMELQQEAVQYLEYMLVKATTNSNASNIGLLLSIFDGTLGPEYLDALSHDETQYIDRVTHLLWDILKVV